MCGRAELQSGHGDLEPVPPLGGRLHPAAQWQKRHGDPSRPVSLPVKHLEHLFPLLDIINMQPADEHTHTQHLLVGSVHCWFVLFVDNRNVLVTSLGICSKKPPSACC